MDDIPDPLSQFFPDQDDVDLYAVLRLSSTATHDAIKKAYRRLALVHHPDKHATATPAARAASSIAFQQVGYAYAVLSDAGRRLRYDETGRTDEEGVGLTTPEDGWDVYFSAMFERVTKGRLDEMRNEYQGSPEEREDLKSAFETTKGNIADIMTYIPHSTFDDEPRLIGIITELIAHGDLKSTRTWQKSSKDEKAKLVRKKQGQKEASEAEAMARELGVWDEFYGSGKPSERKSKANGKNKNAMDGEDDEGDHTALQALILKKQQKSTDTFLDDLAAKYSEPRKGKGKKRQQQEEQEDVNLPAKRSRSTQPPDIDDAEFEKLQSTLFGEKAKSSATQTKKMKRAATRGKKNGK